MFEATVATTSSRALLSACGHLGIDCDALLAGPTAGGILRAVSVTSDRNVYFELTEAFNRTTPTVVLASGQAVVYHRVAIMSKDGDWIIRETPDACDRVLDELEARGARYRPAAPLDVQWLAGGWSSHFEFSDARQRRVRCDFVSRPPRVAASVVNMLFEHPGHTDGPPPLHVVDVSVLIALKQTQRAKDYAVIGELAARLTPQDELAVTTDPDRIIALAPAFGQGSPRRAVRAARVTPVDRRAVVVALAEEIDDLQQRDRRRVAAYAAAAQPYLEACRAQDVPALALRVAHARLLEIAERLLPRTVPGHADAE